MAHVPRLLRGCAAHADGREPDVDERHEATVSLVAPQPSAQHTSAPPCSVLRRAWCGQQRRQVPAVAALTRTQPLQKVGLRRLVHAPLDPDVPGAEPSLRAALAYPGGGARRVMDKAAAETPPVGYFRYCYKWRVHRPVVLLRVMGLGVWHWCRRLDLRQCANLVHQRLMHPPSASRPSKHWSLTNHYLHLLRVWLLRRLTQWGRSDRLADRPHRNYWRWRALVVSWFPRVSGSGAKVQMKG